MRRLISLCAVTLIALGTAAGPALAFEPPGQGAADQFDCIGEGPLAPVRGHPGAAGLVDATPRVGELTADTPAGDTRPTAWSAVDNAAPISLSC